MHNCVIEIVVNPRIDQIREIIMISSQSLQSHAIKALDEMLHSCYWTDFHVERLKDGTLSVFVPKKSLEAEDAMDFLGLLKTIHYQAKKILPEMDIEVCVTFIHATSKELLRHKTEIILQDYAHRIYAIETEVHGALKNTMIPADFDHLCGLKNDLSSLKMKAHEATMFLTALAS